MTQTRCLNERCIGVRIYQRTIVVDGAFVDIYACTRCHTVTSEPARSLDDITVIESDDGLHGDVRAVAS